MLNDVIASHMHSSASRLSTPHVLVCECGAVCIIDTTGWIGPESMFDLVAEVQLLVAPDVPPVGRSHAGESLERQTVKALPLYEEMAHCVGR